MRSRLARNRRRGVVLATAIAGLSGLVAAFAGGATARSSEMPSPRRPPTVTGTPQEGQTLTASEGQWLYLDGRGCGSECVYTFQWQRCGGGGDCFDIPGATARTYVLSAADVGNRIRVANTNTKYDCDARNIDCRYVASGQVSSMTDFVRPRAVAQPTATAPPTIRGIASEREVLTAEDGGWTGPAPITTARQWVRCGTTGENCTPIPGATAPAYTVSPADVGLTLRVVVTATNAGGGTTAVSAPTAVVTPLMPRPGRTSLDVTDVAPPHRLVIDRASFRPNPIRSRDAFTLRVRVSDTRRFRIEGAIVQAVGVPFGLVRPLGERETGRDGFVTFRLTPTRNLELKRGSLVIFLRARKPGDDPLAGVSTRRLVRVRTAAPAG